MNHILDVGCGRYKGYGCPYEGDIIGIDIDPDSQADIIGDLEVFPWHGKDRQGKAVYFRPSEFDAIYSYHCLEHLSDTVKVMDELHRIVKPGGRIRICVPYGASAWALSNPTHKKFFNADAIRFFTEGELMHPIRQPRFRLIFKQYNYIYHGIPELQSWKGKMLRRFSNLIMDRLVNCNYAFYDKILRHYLGDADEIEWELEVIK